MLKCLWQTNGGLPVQSVSPAGPGWCRIWRRASRVPHGSEGLNRIRRSGVGSGGALGYSVANSTGSRRRTTRRRLGEQVRGHAADMGTEDHR